MLETEHCLLSPFVAGHTDGSGILLILSVDIDASNTRSAHLTCSPNIMCAVPTLEAEREQQQHWHARIPWLSCLGQLSSWQNDVPLPADNEP